MSQQVESETGPQTRQANRPGPRSRVWIPVGLVLLAGAGAGGWYAWSHRPQAQARPAVAREHAGAPAEAPGQPVQVSVVAPEKGGLPRYSTMVGSVHPYEYAELFAKVSGFLKAQQVEREGKIIPADIGLHAEKGEILAEIEDPEVVAEAEKAAADVEQAKSQATQAEASLATAKAELEASKAAVKEAEAEVGRYVAHRQETYKAYERYRGLRGMGAVEQDVVDQRQDAYESALAAEGASKAAVVTAQAKVTAGEAKVAQAKADLEAARANIRVAEAAQKKADAYVVYTKIRSPYTGVITARNFHVGDFIRAATGGETKPVLTVARTDLMRIVTKIPDLDVPYADVGDPAVVEIGALPGLRIHATVSRFTEAEDPLERMMRTEIDLPNDEDSPTHGRLREGMYGVATITLATPTDALTVPSACVTGRDEKNQAKLLVLRDGHAHEVAVRTGTDNGVRIEILSGLTPDDKVIAPNGAVTDGSPVRPVETAVAQANSDSAGD